MAALLLFFLLAWAAQWGLVQGLTHQAVQTLRAGDSLLPEPASAQAEDTSWPADPWGGAPADLLGERSAPEQAHGPASSQGESAASSNSSSRTAAEQRAAEARSRSPSPARARGLAFSRELILDLARRRAIPGWQAKPAGQGRQAGIELVEGMPGSGVLAGDRIVAVGGRATPDFLSLTQRVISALIAGEAALSVSLERIDADRVVTLPVLVELPALPEEVREQL